MESNRKGVNDYELDFKNIKNNEYQSTQRKDLFIYQIVHV